MDLMELIEQDVNYHYEVTQDFELGMVNAWALTRDAQDLSEAQETSLYNYLEQAFLVILGANEVIKKTGEYIEGSKGRSLVFDSDIVDKRNEILGQIRINFQAKFNKLKGGK